jgi:hypothetical protein
MTLALIKRGAAWIYYIQYRNSGCQGTAGVAEWGPVQAARTSECSRAAAVGRWSQQQGPGVRGGSKESKASRVLHGPPREVEGPAAASTLQ